MHTESSAYSHSYLQQRESLQQVQVALLRRSAQVELWR